jgi:hypothetical protein
MPISAELELLYYFIFYFTEDLCEDCMQLNMARLCLATVGNLACSSLFSACMCLLEISQDYTCVKRSIKLFFQM